MKYPTARPSTRIFFLALLFWLTLTTLPHSGFQTAQMADEPDLVILNGRVIDPATNSDAVRHLGITNGKIQAISTEPLRGRATIDAKGLVVAPGFIDLHSHGQDPENYRLKAMDGVTTALELEVGTADIDRWYADRQDKALIHYGISIGHIPVRMVVMRDPGVWLPSGPAAHQAAAPAELEECQRLLEQGLKRGAVGVGFGINYTAAASRWEILEMFRVAGRHGAPAFVHLRYKGVKEPDAIQGLEEVLAASAITGTPLHVVHISSTGLRATSQLLQMIAEARSRGLDVTTECYPYTATMTRIESAIYDEGWREEMGIDYKDLQWAETGERLTAESFARYRKQGGYVIGHSIPADIVQLAVTSPLTIIGSDGIMANGKGHPRSAGSYARVLGRFVREQNALSLMDGLRKMTIMPAERLEKYVPMMKHKGRIQPGADADLTIFNPAEIIDQATYEQPNKYSTGIKYVLVNGTPVVKGGQLQEGTLPGRPVRRPIQ